MILPWSASHIAKIRVGHLTGSVYDATHDGDLHPFQVIGNRPDLRGCFLEVEQGSAATQATDVPVLDIRVRVACRIEKAVLLVNWYLSFYFEMVLPLTFTVSIFDLLL